MLESLANGNILSILVKIITHPPIGGVRLSAGKAGFNEISDQ